MYIVDDAHAWRCSDEFMRAGGGFFSSLLPARGALHIGTTDLGDFCRTVLPVLRYCTHLVGAEALDSFCPPVPEFSFKVGMEDGEVTCLATVAYNDWRASLYEPQRPGQPARDLVAEYHVQDIVEEYFPDGAQVPGFDESDDELLYILLTDGLAELGELGDVMVSERLRAIKAQGSPQVRVKATLESGLLDLQVDASGMSPRDLVLFLDSYKRKQKFVRLSSGDIVKLGDSLREVNALAESLGIDAVQMAGDGVGLPSNRTLFVDALLKKASGVRLERNAAFREVVRDFDTYGDADFDVPASLSGILRPYQEEGFRWLETLERFGFGGILADDMGLGKTVQTIAALLYFARTEKERKPSVIIAPTSLTYNWLSELNRFAPELEVMLLSGAQASRAEQIKLLSTPDAPDVLVTSYPLIRRDAPLLSGVSFRFAILDEAQQIKNSASVGAHAVKQLSAETRIALTGTPMENHAGELWSIFDFILPGYLPRASAFMRRYGEGENSDELMRRIRPFLMRRLKKDVLTELPDKLEVTLMAEMSPEQRRVYQAGLLRRRDYVKQILNTRGMAKGRAEVLSAITELRQICCHPVLCLPDYTGTSGKLEMLVDVLLPALQNGRRALVFSQFTRMLRLIETRLSQEGVKSLYLDGDTPADERVKLCDTFNSGHGSVFLLSLKAGGTGLNLTGADMVIHYDPWWNPAAEEQAVDRAHRIGQTKEVEVVRLLVHDSIEEQVVSMSQAKRKLFDLLITPGESMPTKLSDEDLLKLFEIQ